MTQSTTEPYDSVAAAYDSLYTSPEEQALSRRVIEVLEREVGDLSGRSVLDIGCGTGFLLDHVTPGRYLGIDPSGAMLDRLVEKHPSRTESVLQLKLEEFELSEEFPAFDIVVSLFGSVSYADPKAVARIPYLARPDGGQWFVMAYGEGYNASVHQSTAPVTWTTGVLDALLGHDVTFPPYAIRAGAWV